MATVSISIKGDKKEVYDKLYAEKKRTGLSMSALVVEILESHYNDAGPTERMLAQILARLDRIEARIAGGVQFVAADAQDQEDEAAPDQARLQEMALEAIGL